MVSVFAAALLTAATLRPVHVNVGQQVLVKIDVTPDVVSMGTVRAENPAIARVFGQFQQGSSQWFAEVTGLAEGETRIIARSISPVSGAIIWERSVGTVVVHATFRNPVRVKVGESVRVGVDVSPSVILIGSVRAEDPTIATASGVFQWGTSTTMAEVAGHSEGETRLIARSLSVVSGSVIWERFVGTVVVVPADCVAPTIGLPLASKQVLAGQDVTLEALTSGSEPLMVTWVDGKTDLGSGNPLIVTLSRGVHLLTARAANACGESVSTEMIVAAMPRRRAARP